MNKIYHSSAAALDGWLSGGMHVAAGGFCLCGLPELLINAIARKRAKALWTAEAALAPFGKDICDPMNERPRTPRPTFGLWPIC